MACDNPRRCQDSACCSQGKKYQWPELLGKDAMEAKKIIESDNPEVTVEIETKGIYNFNPDFCCNRVIIFANHGFVDIPFPQIG
uniref:Uncharacterized protein n=1 Tax=Chenopodium quinoa TaxID=63459 RepID=A0A803L4X5_CHEQI